MAGLLRRLLTDFPVEKGTESELRSWWPTPELWDGSGLNFGRWTPWCESWFQKRLDKLRCGEGVLNNSREWKATIRMFNKVRPFHQSLSMASAQFLQHDLHVPFI